MKKKDNVGVKRECDKALWVFICGLNVKTFEKNWKRISRRMIQAFLERKK